MVNYVFHNIPVPVRYIDNAMTNGCWYIEESRNSLILSGLALKIPPKKTYPKNQKNHLKKPLKMFFWVL
jgi:hypothetical protein